MGRQYYHQVNFAGGELSPEATWRSDVQAYATGLAKNRNFMAQVKGPNIKRAGTLLVDVLTETGAGRLVPFQRGITQGYVLAFHAGNFRPYDASAYTPLNLSITGIWTETDIDSLYWWRSVDVMLLSDGTGAKRTQVIQHYAADNWVVKDFRFREGPWKTAPENVTLTATGLTGDVYITANQAVFHNSHVGALLRLFHPKSGGNYGRWLIGDKVNQGERRISNERVYEAVLTTAQAALPAEDRLTGSYPPVHSEGTASDGIINWRFIHEGATEVEILEVLPPSAVVPDVPDYNGPLYRNPWEGYEYFDPIIEDYNPPAVNQGDPDYSTLENDPNTLKTRVRVRVSGELPALSTDVWAEQAFSDYRGYPRVGVFHQSRMWLFGTPTAEDTGWSSASFDYDAHSAGFKPGLGYGLTVDSDAITVTAADGTIDPILNAFVGDVLYLGSLGGYRQLVGPPNTKALTPGGTFAEYMHTPGTRPNVRPTRGRNSYLIAEPDGRGVYAIYNDGEEADQSTLADHLFVTPLKTQEWMQTTRTLWAHTEGGVLLSAVIDDAQNVLGWAMHPLGGTNPKVLGLAVMRRPDGLQDLWLMVDRDKLGGGTRRTIEILTTPYRRGRDVSEMVYRDCAFYYDAAIAASVTGTSMSPSQTQCLFAQRSQISDFHTGEAPSNIRTLTGLEAFNGEKLSVFADGHDLGEMTVQGGQIQISRDVRRAVVGMTYLARCCTLPYDEAMNGERVRGVNRRMSNVVIGLLDTLGGKVGWLLPDEDMEDYTDLAIYDDSDLTDDAPPLQTGNFREYDFLDWEEIDEEYGLLQIDIIHDDPYPCALALIEGKVDANG